MTVQGQKTRLYYLFAEIGKALSNPGRLELLDLLIQAPRTVEELAAEAQMNVANASQHLQRLRQARLVDVDKEGKLRRYRVASPIVGQLLNTLRSAAQQQLAEVEQALDAYRTRRHEFERLTVQDLQARLQAGDIILIDVRPEVEYQNGHLPGARSIPLSEIQQALDFLPDNKLIVAYCRGPYCVMADQALSVLRENKRKVARLEEGVTEWQLTGFPISHD
jgi:rhodanese-related sulfurtransferase/DNA-binding transcriptional ArsR family regulator